MISYRVDYAVEIEYEPSTGWMQCVCNTIYKQTREEIEEVIEQLQNMYDDLLLRLTLTTIETIV